MTAPVLKPSRSDAAAELRDASLTAVTSNGPAPGSLRRKPSRSEPEEDFQSDEYQDDHAPERERLQRMNTNEQELPSKAAIPDDFYHKKWYTANDCYKQLDAARAEMAVDEDFVPGSGTVLKEYAPLQGDRPINESKPDRSELTDVTDPVLVYKREVASSHKPSRSEAE